MTSFEVFKNKEFGKLILLKINEKEFFIGRDIAFKLGYTDPNGAMRRNVSNENKETVMLSNLSIWKQLKKELDSTDSRGHQAKRVLLTENGVYELIKAAKHPKGNKLKKRIKEILKTSEIEVDDNCNTSVILSNAETEIFSCSEFGNLTVLEIDNEPWFIGKEVAEKLGYANSKNVVPKYVYDEDKLSTQIEYAGQKRNMTIINESGLYNLIFSSKLEGAKRFKRWVTKDILPSIRKHGAYMTPNTLQEAINNPDFTIGLLEALKKEQNEKLEEQNKRIEAEQQRDRLIHHGKLYTATEIAKELGFKSAQEFNSELERRKIQYKVNGTWVLTARYAEKGYVSIKQLELDNGQITYDRKWTGKGRDFLLSEFAQLKMNVLEENKENGSKGY